MDNRLIEFEWGVAKGGYKWINPDQLVRDTGEIEPLAKNDWCLVEKELGEYGAHGKQAFYSQPLTYTGLWKIFADTPPTKDGILKFANKYGPIDYQSMWRAIIPPDPPILLDTTLFLIWKQQILAMHQVAELWDAIKAADLQKLSEHFYWEEDCNTIIGKNIYIPLGINKGSREVIIGPWPTKGGDRRGDFENCINIYRDKDIIRKFYQKNVTQPAYIIIQEIVNIGLGGHNFLENHRLNCSLFWDDWGDTATKLSLGLTPESLLSALWLQCAQAINNDKDFMKCKQCGNWYEAAPNVINKGKGKVYCSNACKVKSYRERKKLKEATK